MAHVNPPSDLVHADTTPARAGGLRTLLRDLRPPFKKIYSVRPADKTRPYDAPSFQDTDGEQPRRTPRELMATMPGWQ